MNTEIIYYVEWIDARGCHGNWVEFDDMDSSVCKMRSVGFVLTKTDQFIHLVPHYGADPEQGVGDMVIPQSAITKMVALAVNPDE